jgi:hypothetical protein
MGAGLEMIPGDIAFKVRKKFMILMILLIFSLRLLSVQLCNDGSDDGRCSATSV